MLSVKKVAERLGVSPQCVYSLVERGLLECHRIGVGRGWMGWRVRRKVEHVSRGSIASRQLLSSGLPRVSASSVAARWTGVQGQAARWYSWISPPRTSTRSTGT